MFVDALGHPPAATVEVSVASDFKVVVVEKAVPKATPQGRFFS
jgi:hypothetical protein